MSICYLNGTYLSLDQASISPLDRGFLFGDGVYEVVPLYQGKVFRFREHFARLERSLRAISITNPLTQDDFLTLCRKLYQENTPPLPQSMIYLQITRGTGSKREHNFPLNGSLKPTVFAMIADLPLPSAADVEQGVGVSTMVDMRWQHCDIKSTSLLGNVLARQYSFENGLSETILLRDGFLTEASSANVWIVRNGRVIGPVLDKLKLEGIRWQLIRELCEANQIRFEMRPIPFWELMRADEIFLSSAGKEILGVSTIDGEPIGHGRAGPTTLQLHKTYQLAKQRQSI